MIEGVRISGKTGQRLLVSTRRALVVDEDRGDLAYYRAILQRSGWTVVTCSSYDAALDFFRAESFDLVIVSQGSCAFEGRLVLERAVTSYRKTPVLVVARTLDMGCYLEAMRMGATDYLEGPVPENELMRAAHGHLAGTTAAA